MAGVVGLSIAFILSYSLAEFREIKKAKQQPHLIHRWRELQKGKLLPIFVDTVESINETDKKLYRVKSGDTLSAIAQELGVDMLELAELNRIYPPYSLQVGKELEY